MNKKNNMNNVSLIQKQILDSYTYNNEKNIKKLVKIKPINLIVSSLEEIEDVEVIKFVLFATRNSKMGQIFSYLSFEKKVEILENSKNKFIHDLMKEIKIDDLFEFSMDLPSELFKKVIIAIDPDTRKELFILSKYDEEGEASSIMSTSFFKCYEDWTISKTIKEISSKIDKNDFDKFIYVLNESEQLVGKLIIYDIFLEKKKNIKIKDVMDKSVLSVKNNDDIEELIQIFQKYERESLPVVNNDNVMVGLITDNDILPALQEEMTEDIYKMYGITVSDKSYLRRNVFEIFRSRIFWLMILMVVSTLTSVAIDLLTDWSNNILLGSGLSTILLVPIIPVISGTSGNAGSQSAASIIRGLSTGEIEKKDYKKVILKEIQVALLMGITLASFNMIRLMLYYLAFDVVDKYNGLNWNKIAVISAGISLCLFISVSMSKIIGALLPILAIKIKTDPTSMASPMLTTLIDTATTTILFLIGTSIIYAVM